jgi:hypothetical protein
MIIISGCFKHVTTSGHLTFLKRGMWQCHTASKAIYFSDRPVIQYKNRTNFLHLTFQTMNYTAEVKWKSFPILMETVHMAEGLVAL